MAGTLVSSLTLPAVTGLRREAANTPPAMASPTTATMAVPNGPPEAALPAAAPTIAAAGRVSTQAMAI
jgi:hypothetical protein